MLDLLQDNLLWQARGSTGYQNWFHPYKNADYLLHSSYGPDVLYNYLNLLRDPNYMVKKYHVNSQLSEIQHFQPQHSPHRQCVAEIVPGYKHFKRQWVKIDCDQQFHNITIICERQRTNYTPPSDNHVKHTLYANIKYTEKDNVTLIVVNNYCEVGWLYVDDACYRIYPIDEDQCVTLSETLNKHPWKYIIQHFLHEVRNNLTNLFLCRSETTAESLLTVHGLYQCEDLTFIAEHHACDGEADCPDASDEMNCSDVCAFLVPQKNLSCYTLCTSDICICNRLYFQCRKGGCIPLSKFCDGIVDCQDMSDENLCLNESQISYQNVFHDNQSMSNAILCLNKSQMLYQNASDKNHFSCVSGETIDINLVNDTIPDCPVHGDDEVWPNESMPSITVCNDKVMIACIPGHPKMFVHQLLCQLTWDSAGRLAICRNGAHLKDCIYHSCPHQYKCPYSYCIPVHAVCDGRVDCPDGNDETDCHTLLCPHFLRCKADGICVHKNDVNNGLINCPSYHDDELGIKPCPDGCECLGQAVYCFGYHLISYIKHIDFARSLIIRAGVVSEVNNYTFSSFINLKYLDLSDNRFSYIQTSSFSSLQAVVKLAMDNVSLSVIIQNYFQGLINVKRLSLKDNNICRTERYAFYGLISLPELDLSNQMLANIAPCSFQGLNVLNSLDLSYNLISALSKHTFCGLPSLNDLDLRGNDINFVDPLSFTFVSNLQILESNIQGICCHKDFRKCSPKFDDDFASCISILSEKVLHFVVWALAVLVIIDNLVALCTLILFKSNQSKKRMIHTVYQINLTLSDLCMGCYFLLLAIFNVVYEGDYVHVASLWKKGLPCKSLAFLSLFSFQMTMYMTLVLSIERFLALCLPMNTMFNRLRIARLVVLIGWILSAGIATFPFVTTYIQQTQFNNAVCIMMISFKQFHFVYVLAVVILNTITSLCNTILYSCIIYSLRQRQKRLASMTSQQQQTQQDVTITIRIICVVLTNSTCWMTLFLLGILLQSGVVTEAKIFSFCAVSVLPISALLNPVLNIFTTSEFVDSFKTLTCRP